MLLSLNQASAQAFERGLWRELRRELQKKKGEMDAFHGRKEETPDASNAKGSSVSEDGAGGGTRTHTVSLPTDFESVTSTNSITPAYLIKYQLII